MPYFKPIQGRRSEYEEDIDPRFVLIKQAPLGIFRVGEIVHYIGPIDLADTPDRNKPYKISHLLTGRKLNKGTGKAITALEVEGISGFFNVSYWIKGKPEQSQKAEQTIDNQPRINPIDFSHLKNRTYTHRFIPRGYSQSLIELRFNLPIGTIDDSTILIKEEISGNLFNLRFREINEMDAIKEALRALESCKDSEKAETAPLFRYIIIRDSPARASRIFKGVQSRAGLQELLNHLDRTPEGGKSTLRKEVENSLKALRERRYAQRKSKEPN